MSRRKLPYIPDKKLYAAVRGACSWIRQDGYFNKAVNYYADKYDVSVDDVAKYVRIAQGEGQKRANKKNPRKYFYYAIEFSLGNERNNGITYFEPSYAEYAVRKATSASNAQHQLDKNDKDWSEYEPLHWFGRTEAFYTKEEAEACVKKWRKERLED